MSRWFRFYDEAMNDPKLLMLSDAHFRAWVTLLCTASKHEGAIPSLEIAALALRVKPAKAGAVVAALAAVGLLDKADGGYFEPHNWSKRQYKERKSEDSGAYLYFIGSSKNSVVKIGFSKNPWARLTELQTGHPVEMQVLATFKGSRWSENEMHELLDDFRQRGEWFDLPHNLLAMVRAMHDDKASYDALIKSLRELLRSSSTTGALRSKNSPATTETETYSETEADQQSLTSLQITTSEGNFVGDVKRKGWTKPRHCAVSRDKKRVFIWTDTPEWEAYAADFRAIHQQEPQPNSDGGKWFSAQGEAA